MAFLSSFYPQPVVAGTTEGTFAEGNDSRITGAAQKSANLSDLTSASSARSNLGLGTAATSDSGDFSLSSHGHGNISNTGTIGSMAGLPLVTTASGTISTLALGTANQVLRVNSGASGVEFADPASVGVTSVSGTAPIVSSGGTTPAISISAATTSAAGSMSSADKTKLDGIATGATANSSDATLLNRANHTGTQAASTITSLPVELVIACSDETSNLTVGANKVTFRASYAFTLTAVRASVNTAPTGSTLIVDINEAGTSVLSTKLSIDANETTSTTATSAAVISDSSIISDAEITIDIDQVGSSISGKGLKVVLIGTRA